MIRGIGVDVCEISRISEAMARRGKKFAKRILAPSEYDEFLMVDEASKAAFCAKRFAAKEAFSKAFGTGIGRGFGFQDLWVSHTNIGQPVLCWMDDHPAFRVLADACVHLTVSDERRIAVAFCTIESRQ